MSKLITGLLLSLLMGCGKTSPPPEQTPAPKPAGSEFCPADEPCRILPLGDSITKGDHLFGEGNYRIELFRKALAAGQDITFVGNLSNGPLLVEGKLFPRRHQGQGGWTISQISADDILLPALAQNPHIILLHIGTNDIGFGTPNRSQKLAGLIDKIARDAPNALLVVAKIIPRPGKYEDNVQRYNAAIPAIVNAARAKGANIIWVDQHTGFPTAELPDSVHPNAVGYAHIAGVWYEAIAKYLVDIDS